MSEFGERQLVLDLEMIREEENQKEEQFREQFLAHNLFHDDHFDAATEVWAGNPQQEAYFSALKDEFLQDKKGKNMGDRFNLAISKKYVGKIHVTELGKTTNPDINGDVDSLRGEYNDHIKWMRKQPNITLREFTREESERDISVRHPINAGVCDISIAVRNRPLAEAIINEKDYVLRIGIAKRMVFMVDTKKLVPLVWRDNISSEHSISMIEQWLEGGIGLDRPIRGAVRTAYYLATDVKTKD